MSREIKFRYWYANEQVMAGNINMVFPVLSDHPVVMQFTGLTDKNGKEIYEGDIVCCGYSETECANGTVTYCGERDYPAFDVEDLHEAHHYDSNILSFFKAEGEIEVIGNIHENPEQKEEQS